MTLTAAQIATSLSDLTGAPIADDTIIYDSALFRWEAGDATPLVDGSNVIASTVVPATSGAWFRQSSANIRFNQAGTGAVTLSAEAARRAFITVKDFGAVGDGVHDDTSAIQAAINYLQSIVSTTAIGVRGTLYFPSGQYICNGVTITSGNIMLFGPWAELIATDNTKTAATYMINWYGPASHMDTSTPPQKIESHLTAGGIYGLILNSNDKNNFGCLRLAYISHFHIDRFMFSAASKCHAIELVEVFDSTFSRGMVKYSGSAGMGTTDSLAALYITSTPYDSCNRVYFDKVTFENNHGIEVHITNCDSSNIYLTNRIGFIGCKFEQNASYTVYAAFYSDKEIGTLTFSGENYFAGYTRDGCMMDINIGGAYSLIFDPSTQFGFKTGISGSSQSYVQVQGNGHIYFNGCPSGPLLDDYVLLDTTGRSDVLTTLGFVPVPPTNSEGYRWKNSNGDVNYIRSDGTYVEYVNKISDDTVWTIVPPRDYGLMTLIAHDKINMGTQIYYHCATDVAAGEFATVFAGSQTVIATGTLSSGTTGGTDGRMNVSVNNDDKIYIKNRAGYPVVTYLRFEPTVSF